VIEILSPFGRPGRGGRVLGGRRVKTHTECPFDQPELRSCRSLDWAVTLLFRNQPRRGFIAPIRAGGTYGLQLEVSPSPQAKRMAQCRREGRSRLS